MTRRKRKSVEHSVDLANKYRPKTIDQLFGNSILKKTLKPLLDSGKIPQQVLLYGPHGSGKTSIARMFADRLNCSQFDLREIDVADFRGIDSIREIRRTMGTKPMKGSSKVYILDEVSLLGKGGASEKNEAQSALLKALEEPPSHVYFFLCTTDPQNLLKTIKSRCIHYQVQALSEKQIADLIKYVAEQENVTVPKKVLLQIARDSLGHPRDAIKIFEKIINLDEEEMLDAAKQEAEKREQSIALCRALIEKRSWKEVAQILKALNEEPEAVRRAVRGYFASVLLNGKTEAFIVLDALKEPFFNIDAKNELVRCIFEAHTELNS